VASIKKFTELKSWQKSHILALNAYKITETMPQKEQFGLQSQIRRAIVSITSNIAEGFERGSNKEFARCLIMARASSAETQKQLHIARDLGYVSAKTFDQLASSSVEIHKIINRLIKNLRTRDSQTSN
jgi:four helix bundle protein